MEQYHSIVANGVTPESVSELPAAPATPTWPSDEDVLEPDLEEDEDKKEARTALTEASIDAVFRHYITQKPDGKLTKECIRKVFEELDGDFTKRAEQRKLPSSTGNAKNDVSEVYSPPRIADMAAATGLRPGWSLDLTVNKEDGTPWDLSLPHNQGEAMQLMESNAPELLVAFPMCAAFSSLQNLNYRDMTPKELEVKLRAAIEHLDFALKM